MIGQDIFKLNISAAQRSILYDLLISKTTEEIRIMIEQTVFLVCQNIGMKAKYETAYFTKAAEVLHMTQPAVSLAIKELEQYYGVQLFDRIGRRLQITDAGRHFLQYAIHISDLFSDMETGLRDWNSKGILRIGASITIGSRFFRAM